MEKAKKEIEEKMAEFGDICNEDLEEAGPST